MEEIFFCNSFTFITVTCTQSSHTDNSLGIKTHYIAKMHSGTGLIKTLSGEELHLSNGDVFYLPMGLRYHSYWTPDKENGFPVEWESYGFTHLPDPSASSLSMQIITPSDLALEYLSRLNENKEVSPTSVGLLYLFLGEVLPSMKKIASDPRAALFAKAKKFIEKNPSFKVAELAKACNISESGLFTFFREYANTTPVSLKKKILTERAVRALCYTDRTLEDISYELGFCSAAHLRKTVKSITGKTPSEIRRSAKTI